MRTQTYDDLKVIFNRGLLSTQAFSKRGGVEGVKDKAGARSILSDPSNTWRKRLAGQMLYNIHAFFKKGNAFLSQVKSTVLVYKASAKLSRLRSETGIGVGFRRRIYPCKRHPLFLRTQGTRFTALFLFHLRNCSTFHTL